MERFLNLVHNRFENTRNGTETVSVFNFQSVGYISNTLIENNYCKNQQG